jgi:hypothetical protein
MIAPVKQPLRFEMAQRVLPVHVRAQSADVGIALAAVAAGFFCLTPYPALAVGGTSALQIGNVFTLLMVLPIVAMSWRRRAFWIYPLILMPLCFSALKIGVMGDGDIGVSLKAIVVWAISCLTLLIPQLYARRYALNLLTGIAVATMLHAGIGLWQVYSFSNGVFPFAGLYVNQSFLSVQDNAETIAKYTQRPFGLFPEPSAMSSSLAPWVLFWAAMFCGLVRLKQQPARWQQMLFGLASISGLGLIILSQSGHAAVTLAALLLFAVVWFVRCGATLRSYLVIVTALGVVLPLVLWFAAVSLGNRVGDSAMGNSSWEERSASLRLGFSMLIEGDAARAICGVGVGHVAPSLWNAAQIDAVFSVLLTYVYETGLIGVLAIGAIGYCLLRVWKSVRFSLAFAGITGVWLVGITLTTSYEQLLSLWLVLGWLTVWPEMCELVTVRRVAAATARQTIAPIIAEPGVSVISPLGKHAAQLPKRWTDQ